jgi:hypothetical protein
MPDYLINSGLPVLPAGLVDKDAALVTPLYLAVARLAQNTSILTGNVSYSQAELAILNQTGGLLNTKQQIIIFRAVEDIAFGKVITLVNDAGKIGAVLSDQTDNSKLAHGICNSVNGVLTGEYGEAIFMTGLSAGISGTTIGAYYWLSTGGLVQNAPPVTGARQIVGIGMGAAGLYMTLSYSDFGAANAPAAETFYMLTQ